MEKELKEIISKIKFEEIELDGKRVEAVSGVDTNDIKLMVDYIRKEVEKDD